MKYIELREGLKDFTVFSINDIKKIGKTFYRPRLNEWQDKGYIKKVIKGYYIFICGTSINDLHYKTDK